VGKRVAGAKRAGAEEAEVTSVREDMKVDLVHDNARRTRRKTSLKS
jgi:hypothetical protein